MSMIESVRRELETLDKAKRSSSLAVSALMLAREIDSAMIRPSEIATCIRELRTVMGELAKLAPAESAEDDLARIRRNRESRRQA